MQNEPSVSLGMQAKSDPRNLRGENEANKVDYEKEENFGSMGISRSSRLLFPPKRGIYHSLFARKLSDMPGQGEQSKKKSSCPIVIGNSKLLLYSSAGPRGRPPCAMAEPKL